MADKEKSKIENAASATKNAANKLNGIKVSLLGVIICVVIGLVAWKFVLPMFSEKKDTSQHVITESTLEKIVKTSKLSTFETIYNGIHEVDNDQGELQYYVAYEATVKASIDFNNVNLSKDEDEHVVTVTLPNPTLDEPIVDIGTLEYMWQNNDANQSGVSSEAYKECIEDVKEEAAKEEAIIDYAKENAENLFKGLLNPFISKMDGDYSLNINWEDQ